MSAAIAFTPLTGPPLRVEVTMMATPPSARLRFRKGQVRSWRYGGGEEVDMLVESVSYPDDDGRFKVRLVRA